MLAEHSTNKRKLLVIKYIRYENCLGYFGFGALHDVDGLAIAGQGGWIGQSGAY